MYSVKNPGVVNIPQKMGVSNKKVVITKLFETELKISRTQSTILALEI